MSVIRRDRFRLEADGAQDVAYQLDGDMGGTLPVDVEVLAGQLRLFVSRRTAARLGFAVSADGAATLDGDRRSAR